MILDEATTIMQALYDTKNIRESFQEYIEQPIWTASNTDKIPVDPRTGSYASSSDASTWGTFDEVMAYCEKHPEHAPAIVLCPETRLICVDIDKMHDSHFPQSLREVFQKIGSYTEESSSRKGQHIFVRGDISTSRKSKYLEIYGESKIMRVTGFVIEENSEIKDNQTAIDNLIVEYFPTPSQETRGTNKYLPTPPMSDENVIKLCREAKNAEKFADLYDKSKPEKGNSEKDLALCALIAFYTQDREQIDRLFKGSSLLRDKWNRNNYSNMTIGRALEGLTNTYQQKQAPHHRDIQTTHKKALEGVFYKEQPFPINMLPKVMYDAVLKISSATDSDPAIAGTAAQALAGIAIGKKFNVIEKEEIGLKHYVASFYTVVASSAAGRKTANTTPLMKVFNTYHEEEQKIHQQEKRVYDNAKKAAEKAKASLLKVENLSTTEYAKAAADIDLNVDQLKPKFYRLFTTDTTGAAFIMRLNETQGCFSVFTTDGGDLIDFIIGNTQTGTNDMIFVKLITNDSMTIDRVGPDRSGVDIHIPDPCGTVFIMTQEERWTRLNTHPRLRGSGLLGRNNPYIVAPREQGYLEEGATILIDSEALIGWEKLITTLLDYSNNTSLVLSKATQEARRLYNNEVQATVGVSQENYDVADVIHRTVSETVKRAALFHICDHYSDLANMPREIPLATFIRAKTVQKCYLQHAINARRGEFSKTEAREIVTMVEKWLQKVENKEPRFTEWVSTRDITNFLNIPRDKLSIFLLSLEEADVVVSAILPGRRVARYTLNVSQAAQFIRGL